jgi:hypothetical protein
MSSNPTVIHFFFSVQFHYREAFAKQSQCHVTLFASSSLSSLPLTSLFSRLVSSMSRSMLVAGVYTSLVALTRCPVTAISAVFLNRVAPDRHSNLLPLTINGGPHGSFTTVLECSVHQDLAVDVSLGLDWTASAREWLIDLGLAPTSELIGGLISAAQPGESLNRIFTTALLTGSH